ncbi:MAG: HEXXH motif-containing putative peptide modification protein [Sandaracinaceae bacterium]
MTPPDDITIAVGSTDTLRAILSGALKRLLSELSGLGRTAASRDALRLTKAELQRAPGPVFTALRRPTVGVLARVLARRGGDAALYDRFAATLMAELAAAGADLPAVRLDAPRVVCLGAGRALPGGDVTIEDGAWRTSTEHIELRTPSDALPIVHGAIRLALVDDNPIAMDEAHPDKAGNAVDLGGRSAGEWVEALRTAIAPIERYAPLLAEELAMTIQQLVPVGYDAHAHLSASYQEAIGTIYLSLHPESMTMTEAIIHELSHNKLNALFELDPLIENAFSPLYTSPVRPDPRPLHGILLAVHAFLPVEALYRRMLREEDPRAGNPGFTRRLAQIAKKNREGAEVLLANARATDVGRGVLGEIERLCRELGDG